MCTQLFWHLYLAKYLCDKGCELWVSDEDWANSWRKLNLTTRQNPPTFLYVANFTPLNISVSMYFTEMLLHQITGNAPMECENHIVFKWYFITQFRRLLKLKKKPGYKNVPFYTWIIAVLVYSQKYLNRTWRKSWLSPSGSISSNQFQGSNVEIQTLCSFQFSPVMGNLFPYQRSMFQRRTMRLPFTQGHGRERRRDEGEKHAAHVWYWLRLWERNSQFLSHLVLSNILNKKIIGYIQANLL